MNVIFVCTGNTCRSPMAAGYLRSFRLFNVTVHSRGLFADGSPVSANSASVMSEMGIDISEHISHSLTKDDLSADLFICMSSSHREALLSIGLPNEKVFVLGSGISDPYGGSLTVYRACRDEILRAVDELVFSGRFTPFYLCSPDGSMMPQIAELERECFSEPWSEKALLESMQAGTKFFAVCQAGTVLGYVGISTVLDEGYITNVAVTKSARRQGVASLLMHRLSVLARENSLSFISLEVRASNDGARALYQKFGYRDEGLRKGFYRNPTEDAVIMTKRFENE